MDLRSPDAAPAQDCHRWPEWASPDPLGDIRQLALWDGAWLRLLTWPTPTVAEPDTDLLGTEGPEPLPEEGLGSAIPMDTLHRDATSVPEQRRRRRRGGRRGVAATTAFVVLAVGGAATIALAGLSQQHPPRPRLSAGGEAVPTSATSTPSLALAPSEPVAIDIPAIGVHSKLQHLGLNQDGSLEVPVPGPHYDEAAWYRYSPTPGSLGPAIISGHVDSARNGPSVFFRLGDLRPGDQITVGRADGLVADFRVDEVRLFPKDEFPTQLVYGDTDHAALRLLTCGGPFDRSSGHYVDNAIVFGSLVGPGQASPVATHYRSIDQIFG